MNINYTKDQMEELKASGKNIVELSDVYRYIIYETSGFKQLGILDFGCGEESVGTKAMKHAGFKDVTPYDLDYPQTCLLRKYDVILLGDVINLQTPEQAKYMIERLLERNLNEDGEILMSFPRSPRPYIKSIRALKDALSVTTKKAKKATNIWRFSHE